MIRARHLPTRRPVRLPDGARPPDGERLPDGVRPPEGARPVPDRRLDGRSVDGRTLGLDRFLVALAALGWIVTVGWLVMGFGDDAARRVVSDVGETALDLLAAALVLRAGLRIDVRRIRLGWIVVGIAMIVYAVGDGTWAWLDIAGGSTTSPSSAAASSSGIRSSGRS